MDKSKWERAAPLRRNDFIHSSDFTNQKPPVFQKELPFSAIFNKLGERPNMFLLLSYEYQRVWATEVTKYERTSYPPKESNFFTRSCVNRGLLKRKAQREGKAKKMFKMRRFKNTPGRTANRRSPASKEPNN